MAYLSTSDLENYLQTTIPSSRVTWVNTLISAVTIWIEKYLGKSFEGGSAARYYDGNSLDTLLIDDFTGTPTIELLDRDGNSEATLAVADYLLYPLNNTVKNTIVLSDNASYRVFASETKRVKVTANFGYATSVPNDVKLAATMLVSNLYNGGTQDGVVSSETLGDYSISYKQVSDAADDSLGAMELLDNYRDLEV